MLYSTRGHSSQQIIPESLLALSLGQEGSVCAQTLRESDHSIVVQWYWLKPTPADDRVRPGEAMRDRVIDKADF